MLAGTNHGTVSLLGTHSRAATYKKPEDWHIERNVMRQDLQPETGRAVTR